MTPRNNSGDPVVYTITSGNYSNTFALDNSGVLSVADNQALDYFTLAGRRQERAGKPCVIGSPAGRASSAPQPKSLLERSIAAAGCRRR